MNTSWYKAWNGGRADDLAPEVVVAEEEIGNLGIGANLILFFFHREIFVCGANLSSVIT